MTSTILKPKSNFGEVLKNVIKRNIGSVIFIFVLNLLLGVVAVTISVDSYSEQILYFYKKVTTEPQEITFDFLPIIGISCIFCGLFSIFTAPKLFNEIYSKRACDLYFSLPVKRSVYYGASYLTGFVVNLIAMVIPTAIYAIYYKTVYPEAFVYDSKIVFFTFICVTLSLLAIYSAFIMCAVTSGRKFQYFLLSLMCLFTSGTVLTGVIERVNTIWGYYTNGVILSMISPVSNATSCAMMGDERIFKYSIIISVIEIVGMALAGYLIFKNRKAEVAEVSITGKLLPYFMLGLFVFSGFMFTDIVAHEIVTIIVGLIFAVIAGLLYSKIFFRQWFTKATAITTGAVCAVCIIFVGVLYLPGYDNYVKYVPEADEVKSVELMNSLDEEDMGVMRLGLLSVLEDSIYDEPVSLTLTEKEDIEKAIKLHQSTVDDKAIKATNNYSDSLLNMIFYGDIYDDYYSNYNYRITYTLENGRKVTRAYSVKPTFVENELFDIYKNKQILTDAVKDDTEQEDVLFIRYDNYHFDEYDYVDSEETATYSDYMNDSKVIPADKYDELINVFVDEALTLDDNQFKLILSNIPKSLTYSIDNINYVYDGEEEGCLTVYSLSPDATKQQREKLKSMSTEQLAKYCYEVENTYEESGNIDTELYYTAVEQNEISVIGYQKNVLNYVEKVK